MSSNIVPVKGDDAFDIDTYCDLNNMSPVEFLGVLGDLDGDESKWDVSVVEPGEYNPCGRVHIRHESFPEIVEVVIDTRFDDRKNIVYDVHQPMETDILTHEDGVSLETAVESAVTVANSRRTRYFSPSPGKRSSLREVVSRAVKAVSR